ncbi:Atrazine chlorohydrolase [Neomoorella glycerini]|uniref:Atrazine chlorohydrolase n=1 Tax=Neomoorella glycerini TaxID=55779 RepID=A0A6I5ZNN6_9FIRM|nr:amidohydrolase [Moorella glycerini]QGP91225.1 Atrazine chlorohydrolase [Moorella glycerini]
MQTLIKGGWVLTLDDAYREWPAGYVAINGDRITAVGPLKDCSPELEAAADIVLDTRGQAVLPGLVNAHSHLFQTFMRGLADAKPLWNWLKEEIWPFSLAMTEEDFYLAALVGCLENLKNGATSVIDMHYIHTSKANDDLVFEAMQASGIRGTFCRASADQNYQPELMEDRLTILAEMERLARQWHGAAGGRLTLAFGALNPWGCSPELIRAGAKQAREMGLKLQVHVAETQAVARTTIDTYGQRNVEWLADLGFLGPDTQLVHCVWLDEGEMDLAAQAGATLVHCPVANMYLASGAAPVRRWLDRGLNVALATDGPGSNNSQDMLEVLKFTACLQKVTTLNAMVLYPRDVLTMAVRGGARALGREDLGVLAPGMKADIVTVALQRPHVGPVHRAESALVYNANGNDVVNVLVDGRLVVRDHRATLVDEEEIMARAQARVNTLRQKLGKQGGGNDWI